jgi:hypothetical protein
VRARGEGTRPSERGVQREYVLRPQLDVGVNVQSAEIPGHAIVGPQGLLLGGGGTVSTRTAGSNDAATSAGG